jgi:hypothetical protein
MALSISGIDEILQVRKDIDGLVSRVRESAAANTEWLTPSDKSAAVVASSASGGGPEGLDRLSALVSFTSTKGKRCLVQLPPSLAKVPPCPSFQDVKANIERDMSIFTVHSFDGYNFSAEYSHIYRMRTEKNFYPLDVLSVCQRALMALDPLMDADRALIHAQHIIRVAYWDASNVETVGDAALTNGFPSVEAVSDRTKSFHSRIYLGRLADDPNLSCFVRIFCGVKSVVSSAEASREEEAAAAERCQLLLYRKHSLTNEAIDRFDSSMSAVESSAADDKAAIQALQKAAEPVRAYINVTDSPKESEPAKEGQNALDEDDVDKDHDEPGGAKGAAVEGSALRFARPNESTAVPSPCSELLVSLMYTWRRVINIC